MDYLDPGMAARDQHTKTSPEGRQIGRGPDSSFVQSKIDAELEDLSNSRKKEYVAWKPTGGSKKRRKKKKRGVPVNFLPAMIKKKKKRRGGKRRSRRRKKKKTK